jgi:hypothetical protein
MNIKIENGSIVIAEKYDKIKLDNKNFSEYKRKNIN